MLQPGEKYKDYIGQKFGQLTVVSLADKPEHIKRKEISSKYLSKLGI